jgi:glycosyltransferase involved in cell wall biosynthesis
MNKVSNLKRRYFNKFHSLTLSNVKYSKKPRIKYKISIILSVFDHVRFLVDALESIIRQTIGLEHLEVILVYDCCTDKCKEIMERYVKKYTNFKVINLPENSGNPSKPRNVGI